MGIVLTHSTIQCTLEIKVGITNQIWRFSRLNSIRNYAGYAALSPKPHARELLIAARFYCTLGSMRFLKKQKHNSINFATDIINQSNKNDNCRRVSNFLKKIAILMSLDRISHVFRVNRKNLTFNI